LKPRPHAAPPHPQGWATLFLANCALDFNVLSSGIERAPLLTVLLLMMMGLLFLLAGMWLTLQFRWIQVGSGQMGCRRPQAG
jgi:hypothetical protein